ncbi:sigma-w pathway protein ysdB [Halobacillus ihumii]|uniref:sigma-w pathway protein ysdB n=1 Tax=Halobacillus ihumii TaxID=2686092 RepID=UPI0013D3D6C0|nr:sigma-w pathway protein ysdB [Halobacillus ihumii]
MIIILFRILLIIAILFIIYTVYKFMINPRRKLDHAQQKNEFYFHDTAENTKQNFLITYKGLLFEGEKYLGTTEEAFEVVTINIFTQHPEKLKGLERNDLYFLEEQVLMRYPYARIEWKYPINRLNIRPIHEDQ